MPTEALKTWIKTETF